MSQPVNKTKGSTTASEFLCRLKYRNTLPLPSPDSLLFSHLPHASSSDRFTDYSLTSLEKNSQYNDLSLDLPSLIDMSVTLPFSSANAVTSIVGNAKAKGKIAAEDLALCMPEVLVDKKAGSRYARPDVTWLRRAEYGAATGKSAKRQSLTSPTSVQPLDVNTAITKEAILDSIEESFSVMADLDFTHPRDPKLFVKDVLPIYPDFQLWPIIFNVIMMDGPIITPSGTDASVVETARRQVSHAVLRAVSVRSEGDDDGDGPHEAYTYMSVYVPTPAATSQIAAAANSPLPVDATLEYKNVRDYNYSFQPSHDRHYVLIHRPDAGLFYNRIDSLYFCKRRDASASRSVSPKINVVNVKLGEAEEMQHAERIAELLTGEEFGEMDVNFDKYENTGDDQLMIEENLTTHMNVDSADSVDH